MKPTKNIIISVLFIAFLVSTISISFGNDNPNTFSNDVINRIVKKYKNKPGFVKNNKKVILTPSFIQKNANLKKIDIIPIYREIMNSHMTIENLSVAYSKGLLPNDLNCGEFEKKSLGQFTVIDCESDLGEITPFVFYGKDNGQLDHVEINVNYKRVYRQSLERAIKRGVISEFYDAYVDLQTEIFVESLNSTAGPNDLITTAPEAITIKIYR